MNKEYEVWISGYLCTGMEGIPVKAQFLGRYLADSFRDACKMAIKEKKWETEGYFNEDHLTYWGRGLYDNEGDARKSFG